MLQIEASYPESAYVMTHRGAPHPLPPIALAMGAPGCSFQIYLTPESAEQLANELLALAAKPAQKVAA